MPTEPTAPSSKHSLLQPWPLALIAVIVFGAALTADRIVHAKTQEQEISPETTTPSSYAEFQYATLTGTNNTINATLVPVVTASGTAYKNFTFQVNVAANGSVTIVPGSPTVVASSTTQAGGFKAGTYLGPYFGSNSEYQGMVATVSGPGIVAGGYTNWSFGLAAASTASCPYPTSATWYVGPPISPNNPVYARLKAAGITSAAYSYGTGGTPGCDPNDSWYPGSLIGVSQSGNGFTISSFSLGGGPSNGGKDYSAPTDEITFTLKQ